MISQKKRVRIKSNVFQGLPKTLVKYPCSVDILDICKVSHKKVIKM